MIYTRNLETNEKKLDPGKHVANRERKTRSKNQRKQSFARLNAEFQRVATEDMIEQINSECAKTLKHATKKELP